MAEELNTEAIKWARQALKQYGLVPQRVEVLRHLGNLVLRVETPEPFCLRICTPGADESQLRAEIEWLDALNGQTNLRVPRPVPARVGTPLSEVGGRYCVLFQWIEGEPVSRAMSVDVASVTGEVLATLHRHAQGFNPTAKLRRRYDAELAHRSSILVDNRCGQPPRGRARRTHAHG